MDIAVAMDGSVGVIYCEAGEGEQGESEDGHQGRKGDNAEDGLESSEKFMWFIQPSSSGGISNSTPSPSLENTL